jgi:O-antigen biosynthesis protein
MASPLVDVIIPVYNKSNLVLRLIASLRNQKRLGQIVIMDDASSEIDETVLKTIEGVKYYRNIANSGFITSVRRGVSKSSSDYILILNSDTEAYHPHCLEYMAENLDDGAAVVGALLLYPKDDPYRAESIQHCGIYYDSQSGFPRHIMAGFPKDTPMANVRRSVPAVTGACLMTTRKWWDKVGGFDQHLQPAVLEDVDYCIQVKKLGGEIIYEPRAVLTHFEHASQGQNGNWFSNEQIHKNFTYLMMKHGQQPPSDSYWFKGL